MYFTLPVRLLRFHLQLHSSLLAFGKQRHKVPAHTQSAKTGEGEETKAVFNPDLWFALCSNGNALRTLRFLHHLLSSLVLNHKSLLIYQIYNLPFQSIKPCLQNHLKITINTKKYKWLKMTMPSSQNPQKENSKARLYSSVFTLHLKIIGITAWQTSLGREFQPPTLTLTPTPDDLRRKRQIR